MMLFRQGMEALLEPEMERAWIGDCRQPDPSAPRSGGTTASRATTKGSWRGMSACARPHHSFHYKFPTPHYPLLAGGASVGQFCAV